MKLTKTKKVIGGFILGSGIFIGGANVYATTVLDTSLLSVITKTMDYVSSNLTKGAKNGVSSLSKDKNKNINSFVNERADRAISELEATKNSEIKRAQGELDAHYNQLVMETDSAFTRETNRVKQEIKSGVDKEVSKSKSDMTSELKKALDKKMDEIEDKYDD